MLFGAEIPDNSNLLFILLGGGVLSCWILKLVFDFLSKKRNDDPSSVCFKCQSQIADLHRWHSPDEGGEQHWKNASLSHVIEELSGVVQGNTEAMNAVVSIVEKLQEKIEMT